MYKLMIPFCLLIGVHLHAMPSKRPAKNQSHEQTHCLLVTVQERQQWAQLREEALSSLVQAKRHAGTRQEISQIQSLLRKVFPEDKQLIERPRETKCQKVSFWTKKIVTFLINDMKRAIFATEHEQYRSE